MSSTRYAVLLRGINVGGNQIIKMDALRAAFVSLGLGSVKTLLASGNVVFDAEAANRMGLASGIEAMLRDRFGFAIPVLLRTLPEIQDLVDSEPFKGTRVTPATRLYVTFLSEEPSSTLVVPYRSLDGDFEILRVSPSEVCSVLTISATRNTTAAMQVIEKVFGRNVTTRNWNTVLKLLTV